MKILLYCVDDEITCYLEKTLTGKYKIYTASTYYNACKIIKNIDFDLVLTEIGPDDIEFSGIDLLKVLHASSIEIPFIILTLKQDISLAVEYLKLGAFDVIEITGNVETSVKSITDAVNNYLNNHLKEKSNSSGSSDFRILIVDDNEEFTKSIEYYFNENYYIDILNDFLSAKEQIDQNNYDCVFLDLKDDTHNNDNAGIDILKYIQSKDKDVPVIMLSGWADTSIAVECLKIGALDFIEKSLKIFDVIEKIDLILRKLVRERLNRIEESRQVSNKQVYSLFDIIGDSAIMKKIRKEIINIADHDVPVLVYGETGTGKEMVASAIHTASCRKDNNFIELNCGSIPEELFESELFGFVKGAFSGAAQTRKGKMELAHQGTLFLDEIENLPLEQQAKLLRVLEDKKVCPLGSNAEVIVDFRLICATNIDLQENISKGLFREDLFFRINVYNFHLPPLRERGLEDIKLLIDHFLNKDKMIIIENDALDLINNYSWPGNIRELKNIMKKIEIDFRNNPKGAVNLESIKDCFRGRSKRDGLKNMFSDLNEYYNGNVPNLIKDFEDLAVMQAYKKYNGNISKIAKIIYQENPEDNKNYRERVRKVLERNKSLVEKM